MAHSKFKRTSEKVKEKTPVHQKIKDLEDELAKTKYNKRTQHHIGLVKAKIDLLISLSQIAFFPT